MKIIKRKDLDNLTNKNSDLLTNKEIELIQELLRDSIDELIELRDERYIKRKIKEDAGILMKEIRIDHNLSQRELANKLGLRRQAVSSWERKNNMPSLNTLIKFYKVIPDKRIKEIVKLLG